LSASAKKETAGIAGRFPRDRRRFGADQRPLCDALDVSHFTPEETNADRMAGPGMDRLRAAACRKPAPM
jgi:hypothetical protein